MADIVTRLRELAENMYSPNAVDVIREATREVEDLKAQLGNLRFLYDGAQIDIKRLEARRNMAGTTRNDREAEVGTLQDKLADADLAHQFMLYWKAKALAAWNEAAALPERVKKLEAVAEVAKRDAGRDGAGVSWEMTEALKDLWRQSRD